MTTDHLSAAIVSNVAAALAEDIGPGDITADLISDSAVAEAIIVARHAMTMAGQPWVNEVFNQLDPEWIQTRIHQPPKIFLRTIKAVWKLKI